MYEYESRVLHRCVFANMEKNKFAKRKYQIHENGQKFGIGCLTWCWLGLVLVGLLYVVLILAGFAQQLAKKNWSQKLTKWVSFWAQELTECVIF